MKNIAGLVSGLIMTALLLLGGCSGSGASALLESSPREEYQAFLRTKIVSAKAFDFETASPALVVKALPYDRETEERAVSLFHADPLFSRETDSWNRVPPKGKGPVQIVLMGLFVPDLKEKDIKNGRFRPALKTPEGRILRAADIKRHGRDSAFARDYFPVFDRWEEVFVVKFQMPAGALRPSQCEFMLEWPGGTETVPLSAARSETVKTQGF